LIDKNLQSGMTSIAHPVFNAPPKSGTGSGSSGGGPGGGSSSGGGSNGGSHPHRGVYNDRQQRADFNALRRSGDWDALEVSALILWGIEIAADEDEC